MTSDPNCKHSRTITEQVEVENWMTGEIELVWSTREEHWTEDIDTGRFRCTRCGLVMYYTGLWRDYFEKGIPCPGSDRIKAYKP